MNRLLTTSMKGFTIIELMIVLVIVSILLALAYPSYIDYARKSKRGEAQQMLMNWSINQEIWRSNNTTYDDGTGIDEPCTSAGSDCNYDFSVSGASATAYILTADAKDGNDQEKDASRGTNCATLTIDQDGQKLPAVCWE